jgi:NAD-dependent deacetylase
MSLAGYRHIVVLTGAGISQAAGLPTYRGPGGLWNDASKIALSDLEAMRTRRAEVCAMFWQLYRSAREVRPTAAHRALAAFEAALPAGAEFTLITQNVDGLHQAAGSRSVCELHGSLARWRCERCGTEQHLPDEAEHCGEPMRPCVVLFGEELPTAAEHTAKRALRDCDLFVAIGTSGTVTPAASFVRWAAYAGARRMLLNLEIDARAYDEYSECHAGTADELVARWFVSAPPAGLGS